MLELDGKQVLITVAGEGIGRVSGVLFASNESAFTTGQTHVIDGGWSV